MHTIPAQARYRDALHCFIDSLPPGSLADTREGAQFGATHLICGRDIARVRRFLPDGDIREEGETARIRSRHARPFPPPQLQPASPGSGGA